MPENARVQAFSINLPQCHGCGACVAVAPDLFAMDSGADRPRQLTGEAPEEAIRRAMAYCPNDCIEIDGKD